MTPRAESQRSAWTTDLIARLEKVWQRDAVQPSEQVRRAVRQWLERKGVIAKVTTPSRRGGTHQEGYRVKKNTITLDEGQ
jgi:hypothetical protein